MIALAAFACFIIVASLGFAFLEFTRAIGDYWRDRQRTQCAPSGPVWWRIGLDNPDDWTLQAHHIRKLFLTKQQRDALFLSKTGAGFVKGAWFKA